MTVTKACLYLEIDGKTCLVKMSDVIDLNLMVNMISSLTERGKLKIIPLNGDHKWKPIDNEFNKEYGYVRK